MPTNSRRELARFLRKHRERVRPQQVGIPTSPRRRSRGLRREEVAVFAGVSPTWYAYLEQGRDIHPSPEVLNSIARVLHLTEDERRYMHILVYGVVADPQPVDADVPAELLIQSLVDAVGDSSYPVYSVNHRSDLIAWNSAATEWYDDWDRLPIEERNMMRWMLTTPRARERLVDWEEDTRDAVARWRVQTAKWPHDKLLQQYIADFKNLSGEFSRWWNSHDVKEHRTQTRRIRHPRLGVSPLRLLMMQTADFTESYVVFHLPLDFPK